MPKSAGIASKASVATVAIAGFGSVRNEKEGEKRNREKDEFFHEANEFEVNDFPTSSHQTKAPYN